MFSLFKRGGLRAWILALLRQSPKNGTEIMDHIEMASQGWWRPSPGSVYPLLEELSRDGFIRKREDGRYEMTEKECAGTRICRHGEIILKCQEPRKKLSSKWNPTSHI